MGGRTTPRAAAVPPPIAPPGDIDQPEQELAELEFQTSADTDTSGRDRKYRKVSTAKGSSTSKGHSKYAGGGLAGYDQSKTGNA